MTKAVNLAIIGTGVVGSAYLNQLKAIKSSIAYNVILIAKSKNAWVSRDYSPLDLSTWNTSQESNKEGPLSVPELVSFLSKSPVPAILVDNTSDGTLASQYPLFVENGVSIATPNKKGFSSELSLWNAIFEASAKPGGGLVYHEATVGAGLPIISTINDLVATGDEITTIEGIFSGSLSFIFNSFSTAAKSSVKFSDIVAEAKKLGYTEPDPREDLNGLDFARKVAILARLSGKNVESATSFPVHSLIPKPLESIESADEFMEKLPEYDADMDKLRAEALAEQKVLRLVGVVDLAGDKLSVSINKYDFSHPFASLQGSDNVISIKTKRYTNPLIIQGAGAGAEVTAAGVLADTIKIAQRIA